MRRLSCSLSLIILAAALGVSTGVAQPSSSATGASAQAGDAAVQADLDASGVISDRRASDAKIITRAEVESVMLGELERNGSDVALDLRSPNSKPLQQESSDNRRVYYIVGGALVAGGLVAGILALDDGGGGGGPPDGGNIPPPPTRP